MTISIDDRQLVESYQAGDTDAFAELVRAHGPSLLGHAIRKLGDRAAAEDAVQETFVRAFRALPRFDGDYRVGPWLHRILANVCADEGNRRRREAEKFDRFAADPFAADLAPGVEDELGLDLDDKALSDALASLPPTYREALNLRFVQELPYDEVARIAGVSEENARARVSRARSAARSALRGVAAIPLLIASALRRSESVAAAATQGEGVRAAAEAAVASAPAATPMVTKAVIGLGVVAAVVAPSSAPLEPDGGRALVAVEATADDVAPPATPVVDDVAPLQPNGSGGAVAPEGVGSATEAPADHTTSEPEKAPTSAPEVVDPAPLPSGGASAPVSDGAEPAEPVEPAPVVRVPGTLTVSALALTPAGPRFAVSGTAELVVGDATFAGPVTGRVSFTDRGELRRVHLDLTLSLDSGATVEIRAEALGQPVADQAGLELAEVTAFELSGPFRVAADSSVHLLESGTVSGLLDLAGPALTLRLG